jgi:16S rRNA processing protein RimM
MPESNDQRKGDRSVTGRQIKQGIARQRPVAPAPRRASGPPPLAETTGPDRGQRPDDVRLTVAVIERPHGVQGELQARITTDTPDRLLRLKTLYLGDEPAPRKVLGARFHKDRVLYRLSGITTPEQVRALYRTPLRIPGTAAAPLAEGEYFLYQLIDSTVVDESGTALGVLVDIMETGANEVYVVRPAGGGPDLLLPNIPSVVLTIDVENSRITVRQPEYA